MEIVYFLVFHVFTKTSPISSLTACAILKFTGIMVFLGDLYAVIHQLWIMRTAYEYILRGFRRNHSHRILHACFDRILVINNSNFDFGV
jgi:hypothetical protein